MHIPYERCRVPKTHRRGSTPTAQEMRKYMNQTLTKEKVAEFNGRVQALLTRTSNGNLRFALVTETRRVVEVVRALRDIAEVSFTLDQTTILIRSARGLGTDYSDRQLLSKYDNAREALKLEVLYAQILGATITQSTLVGHSDSIDWSQVDSFDSITV